MYEIEHLCSNLLNLPTYIILIFRSEIPTLLKRYLKKIYVVI